MQIPQMDNRRLVRRPALWLLVLAASCARSASPTAVETALPPTEPAQGSLSPTAAGPTPIPAVGFSPPIQSSTFPADLAVLSPENLDRVQPVRRLTADALPALIEEASLAFLPSYQFELAALLDDGQLLIWNMATAAVTYRDQHSPAAQLPGRNPALTVSHGFQGYLASAARISAIGTAQAVVVRPPDDRQEPLVLSGASDSFDLERINGLSFSPDGQLLAAALGSGDHGLVKVWDVSDTDAVQLRGEAAFSLPAQAVQFTPEGPRLLVATGRDLVQLDPSNGLELDRRSMGLTIQGVALGPSGDSLAVWSDQQAVLTMPGGAAPLLLAAVEGFRSVDFSPDERLAVLVDGDRLRFWDMAAGVERISLRHTRPFLDAGFHGDGRVLAAIDAQGGVFLWGAAAGAELPAERTVITQSNAAQLVRAASLYLPGGPQARFTSDGRELTVGGLHGIYLVELPSLEMREHLPPSGGSTVFATSPDDRWIAQVIEPVLVRIWNRQSLRPQQEIRLAAEFCCSSLTFTPDGRTLITHSGFGAQVWDLQTGSELYSRPQAQAVHVSPDGTRLAFQEGLEVNLIQWPEGQLLRTLTGFETASPVVGTGFSPSWEVMFWAGRATIQFIDVQSGQLGAAIPFSWGRFSPEGDRLAAVEAGWTLASVGEVHQFDVHSGETLTVFDHQEDAIVDALTYSPDGGLLVSATEFSVKVWDARSGAELATLPISAEGVYDLAFSPDGRMLITVGQGDLIELWVIPGAETASDRAIGGAPADRMCRMALSPAGTELASTSNSGLVQLWGVAG